MRSKPYTLHSMKQIVVVATFLFITGCCLATDIHSWLKSQEEQHGKINCKQDGQPSSEKSVRFVELSRSACESRNHIKFTGQLDSFMLPKGFGTIVVKESRTSTSKCLVLPTNVEKIQSNFINSLPHGRTTVHFRDGTFFVANCFEGVLHGFFKQFREDGTLQVVGRFDHGVVNGPVWLISHDFNQDGALLLHIVSDGEVQEEAIFFQTAEKLFFKGQISKQQNVLINATANEATATTFDGCVLVPKTLEQSTTQKRQDFYFPIKFNLNRLPFDVYRSKFLFFNRVAKAGSQNLINLMVNLENMNGYGN